MTITGTLLLIFILVSLVHLAAEGLRSAVGRYITKPLLMPALALYYIVSAAHPNFIFVAAILCGFLGDVLLMLPDRLNSGRYFKPGLASFALGHILYIAVFASCFVSVLRVSAWGWATCAFYAAAGIVGYRFLAGHAGKLRSGIIAYITIITCMAVSTILPLGNAHNAGVFMAMAGAFLFMVSDMINAYNRLVSELRLEWLLTMGTYLAAQFLLVQGYLYF